MEKEKKEVCEDLNIEVYLSINRCVCGFMHNKSSRKNLLSDLDLTLELLSALRGDTRKEITIPAIGMGLWKEDPYMVLKKIKEWVNKINNISFEIIVNDQILFRTILTALEDLNKEKQNQDEEKNTEENRTMDLTNRIRDEERKDAGTDEIYKGKPEGSTTHKKKRKSWIPRLYRKKRSEKYHIGGGYGTENGLGDKGRHERRETNG